MLDSCPFHLHIGFPDKHYEELSGICGVLRTLTRLITLAAQFCEESTEGNLFVPLEPAKLQMFLTEVDKMARDDFYGPCFGFYYTGATASIMKLIQVKRTDWGE